MDSSLDKDSSVAGLLRDLEASDQHSLVCRAKVESSHKVILIDLLVHPTEDGVQLMVVVPVKVGGLGGLRLDRRLFIVNQLLNVSLLQCRMYTDECLS